MIEPTGVLHIHNKIQMFSEDETSAYKTQALLVGGDIIECTREFLFYSREAELTPLGDGRYIIDGYLLTPLTLCDNINKSIFFKVTDYP